MSKIKLRAANPLSNSFLGASVRGNSLRVWCSSLTGSIQKEESKQREHDKNQNCVGLFLLGHHSVPLPDAVAALVKRRILTENTRIIPSVICSVLLARVVIVMKAAEKKSRREAAFIEPMECALVANAPDGPQWVYEIKLDGYDTFMTVHPDFLEARSWIPGPEPPDVILTDIHDRQIGIELTE